MINYNVEDVKHVFETNPGIDHVLVTEDQHTFLPKFKQFCEEHCKLNNIKFAKLLRVALDTKSIGAVAIELVKEVVLDNEEDSVDKTDENENLNALSFLELKSRCKKIDLRMNPKNKAEAIEMLQNASKLNQEVSPNNTVE